MQPKGVGGSQLREHSRRDAAARLDESGLMPVRVSAFWFAAVIAFSLVVNISDSMIDVGNFTQRPQSTGLMLPGAWYVLSTAYVERRHTLPRCIGVGC